MLLPGFDFLDPENLEEALDLLAVHKDDAKVLAGGTDLLVRMKKGLLTPKVLISLKSLNELSHINGARSAYRRLACRSAVDYPIVCAGVLVRPSDSQKDRIDEARIVVGAMGNTPCFGHGPSMLRPVLA